MIIYVITSLPMTKVGTYLFEVDDCHCHIEVKYFRHFFKVEKLERVERLNPVRFKANMDILVGGNDS